MKLVVLLALSSLIMAMSSLAVQAQAMQLEALNPATWTPSTVLAVFSVVFSCGVAWQTLRVQAGRIRDLYGWRSNVVEPTLTDYAVDIGRIYERLGIRDDERRQLREQVSRRQQQREWDYREKEGS